MTESSAATETVLSIELLVVSVVGVLLPPQAIKKILPQTANKPKLVLIDLFIMKIFTKLGLPSNLC
jgi:hypothetical protein